ncbi:hypothetical protein CP08DC60_0209B, partial [Chlamydia psittaci 08DC60]
SPDRIAVVPSGFDVIV